MRKINNIRRLLAVAMLCVTGALLLPSTLSAQQQSRMVHGTVIGTGGEALVGAIVSVTGGTAQPVVSGVDGKFGIMASSNQTLSVTYLGYMAKTVPASSTEIVITLEPDNTTLEQVVVVGYGTQRKVTMTGAVSAIGNKDIVVTKNENVVNMLSGKIPGVRITQSSSQPGNFDDTKINIRGYDGDPMFVVDGVVRDKGYFSRMDASEIDNVSVLKDGSAAVYGVQGGRGVILVTTKRGQASDGKFNINLSANMGWQNFLYIPQTNNAAAHMILINEKQYNNLGASYPLRGVPEYSADEMLEYAVGKRKSTNWVDELFSKNVPQKQYNLSMDGGSDKVNYFFNLGFLDQQGSYKSGSLNYNRWNFRSNTDIKITQRLKASVSVGGYLDERNEPNTGIWTVYKKAWTYRPTASAWLDGDKSLPAFDEFLPSERENPVATTDSDYTGYRRDKNANLNASFSATYDIPWIEGLSLRGFYDYTYHATNNKSYQRKYYTFSRDAVGNLVQNEHNPQPVMTRRTDPSYNETYSVQLNYTGTFGPHNVGGTLVWEERQGASDGFFGARAMSLDGDYLLYGDDEGQTSGQGALDEWGRRALVGRGTYNYKERYMAEFAFRYEAASNFPKKGMWELFPSGSVAWRIAEEPFVKNAIPFLNNLKLRASYGMMGGGDSSRRAVTGYRINEGQVGWFYPDYMIGVTTNSIPNENLTWTVIHSSNVGLDFDLWNGMLSGSFDVFNSLRTGIPRKPDTQIPTEVGSDLPEQNIDSDRTFGWEISLGHRNQIGDVRYWVNGQISATKNRWVSRQDSQGANSSANYRRVDVSGRNKNIWFNNREEGGRFSSYDEIRWHDLPIDQGTLPGDYWYEDWNGDGVINGDDGHPVATFELPTFNYGISLGAEWRGIDLAMNWQGSAGVYSTYGEVFTEVGPFGGGASLDFYMDRWRTLNVGDDPWNPNTQWIEGLYPATGHSFSDGTSGIRNASYIRLKSVELGYTFPDRWLDDVGVKDLRVYVNGYNLLTFTGLKNIDPERPGSVGAWNTDAGKAGENAHLFYRYPVNRTINVGASLKF